MLIILSSNLTFSFVFIIFVLICIAVIYFASKSGGNYSEKTETKIVKGQEIKTVTKIKGNKVEVLQYVNGKQVEPKELSEKEKNKMLEEQQEKFDKMEKDRKKQKRNEKISKFFGTWKKNYFKKRKIQKNKTDNNKQKKAAVTSLLRTIFKI